MNYSFVFAILATILVATEAHKNTHSGHTHAGFKCPTEDGYFTHPNCLKFYQCGNWIAYEMPCAPGTHWNQTLLTCDHETTCQSEEPESPVEEPVPTTVEPTTVAPVEPTPAPEQPGQGFKCPTESGYFPHEDCWKFWQCGNNIAYEMTCAPGTQWEQSLLTCDHLTTCQRPAEPTQVPEEPETEAPEEPTQAPEQPPTSAPVEPTTAAPEQPGNGFKCPTESGYFPHEDCWKFWQCGNNIAYEMTCAPGTQWEQSLLTCDHLTTCQRPAEPTQAPEEPETEAPAEPTQAPAEPTQAPVEPTEAPVEPTEAPVEPTEAPVEPTEAPVEPTEAPVEPTEAPVEPTEAPVEPTTAAPEQPGQGFKCPTESGYFPHEDCWKFWQCGNNIAYEMTCAPGTQWEQSLLTCDHLTTCQRPAEPTATPEEPETEAPAEPTVAPVEPTEAPVEPTEAPVEPTQAPQEPTTAAPEQPGQGFKCPTDSGYFPHEDCWKFWQCGNGIAYEMTCAPGTQWEQSLLTCDHLTTCQRPAEPTQAPEEPETEAPEEPTQAPEQPPTSAPVEPTAAPEEPTTAAPEQPGNGFKCPTESGYFPHEDCWKFWQCGNNIAYEMTCAPGTQWEQSLLTCDHLTTCQRPAEPTAAPEEPETEAPEEPTQAPEQPPTSAPVEPTAAPEEPSTAAPEQPGNGFKCPTESGYFPHEDCWKFWQCGNNIAYEMTCAPGTQWEQSLLTCIHLDTCQRPPEPEEPTAAPEEPTSAPVEPTQAPQEPTQAPQEPTQAPEQPGQGFKCPTESGYFPHEDCWKFWQCGNNIAYEMTCAPGTQWEQSLLTCIHLDTCQRPPEPVPEEPVQEPVETPAPPPPTAAPEEDATTFTCPARSGNYAHETCWKYWNCRNGVAHEMTCYPYTSYDQRIQNCRGGLTCKRY